MACCDSISRGEQISRASLRRTSTGSRCGSINARGRPWASKPLPIDYEQCCSDQLNPQHKADVPVVSLSYKSDRSEADIAESLASSHLTSRVRLLSPSNPEQTNCLIDGLFTVCAALLIRTRGNHDHTIDLSCIRFRRSRLVRIGLCTRDRHRCTEVPTGHRVQRSANGPAANRCAVWRPDKAGSIRLSRQVLGRLEGSAALAS